MELKEDISKILFAIYRILGEFAIGSIIAFGFWQAMKELTNWAIMFFILGVLLATIEVLTPILAGFRIYTRIFRD